MEQCAREHRSDPTSAPYKKDHLGQILYLFEPRFLMDKPETRKKKFFLGWTTRLLSHSNEIK